MTQDEINLIAYLRTGGRSVNGYFNSYSKISFNMDIAKKENPTIYIVTSGEDSDYCIEAVFTDKALAEDYVSKITGTEIEEFTANEEVLEDECFYYAFISEKKIHIETTDNLSEIHLARNNAMFKYKSCYHLYFSAKNTDQALNIASERHSNFLAHNLYQEGRHINYHTQQLAI